jgi:uncharacterized protein (DUF58 family)
MTLVVAIGATNTGNNGLYLLVSLFLGALVVSGVVSRRNVERVGASLEGPHDVFAGEPVRFTLTLKNDGRLARRALLVKISGAAAPILFGEIPARGESSRGVDLVFPRRGRRVIESLLVYSGYPIGLFRKGRLQALGEERIVYPRPAGGGLPPPDPRDADQGTPRSHLRGRGQEIRNLREAGFGDDPRDVHWPQTARQGRFIVKERMSEEGRDAIIVLDLARPSRDAGFEDRVERAVSRAAGFTLELLSRGQRVGLAIGSHLIPPDNGPAHRRALLSALALAEPSVEPAPPAAMPPGAAVYTVHAGLETDDMEVKSA